MAGTPVQAPTQGLSMIVTVKRLSIFSDGVVLLTRYKNSYTPTFAVSDVSMTSYAYELSLTPTSHHVGSLTVQTESEASIILVEPLQGGTLLQFFQLPSESKYLMLSTI